MLFSTINYAILLKTIPNSSPIFDFLACIDIIFLRYKRSPCRENTWNSKAVADTGYRSFRIILLTVYGNSSTLSSYSVPQGAFL